MKHILPTVVLFIISIFQCEDSFADEARQPKPLRVTVGLYLNDIIELNFKEEFAIVDFWVWFRWNSSDEGASEYKPVQNLEIINGHINSTTGHRREQTGNTIHECVRIVAKITIRFDLKSYPLDSHVLRIRVEDQEKNKRRLTLVADVDDSGASPNIKLGGWTIVPLKPYISMHSYKTDFGRIENTEQKKPEYCQFRYLVCLRKPLFISVFKTMWATFIATLVALLAILLSPSFAARFGLGVGALFAAIAAKISIAGNVQYASEFGFTDAVQAASGVVILITIIWSVVAYRIVERNPGTSKTIIKSDSFCAAILFIAYTTTIVLLILEYKPL